MRALFSSFILTLVCTVSTKVVAADQANLSFGLGADHGGLGIKYSSNLEDSKIFISAGLLSCSTAAGSAVGYGIGWERMLASEDQGIGLFLGSTGSQSLGDEKTTFLGASLFYNYYFSGFFNDSMVIGASASYGVSPDDEPYFHDSDSSLFIKVAYQW